jgi:hypothetical protein
MMRLEVNFQNVKEIYQENSTKPITWESSNMKRLIGRSLAEDEE